jgi:predicted methyltransferase
MQIFKDGVVVTQELKALRLLSNVSGPISLTAITVVRGLTIEVLLKMKKEGLILMDDNAIQITEKGTEKYKKCLHEEY